MAARASTEASAAQASNLKLCPSTIDGKQGVSTPRDAMEPVAKRIYRRADRVPTPLSYRPADAAFVLGVCRGTVYDMIADGRLEGRKLGTATVVLHESLVALLAAAPLAEATKRARS